MNAREYVDLIEKKIFKKGHLVSSWYSSSRNQRVGSAKANLLVRGNMKVKGYLFSRIFSKTTPDWETLTVVFSPGENEEASVDGLKALITSTENYMTKNNIKWAWLAYVSETGFDRETIEFVEARLKREIGIMLVDPVRKHFVRNNVLVSKHGERVFKL